MNSITSFFAVLCLATLVHGQDDVAKEEIKKLQGTWVRTSCSVDGKVTEDGDRPPEKQVTLVIKNNRYDNMPFTIDVTKSPHHIDIQDIGPKGKQFTLPGIYEIKDNELKICLPYPFEGKFDQIHKRPTEFVTKQGENHVVEVYRRKK